jgi:hypothetical protein
MRKYMASGEAVRDIIGDDFGTLEIGCSRDLEIGFSLNPAKALRSVGRTIRNVKRATVDKVPVVRDVAGGLGKTYDKAAPYLNVAFPGAAGILETARAAESGKPLNVLQSRLIPGAKAGRTVFEKNPIGRVVYDPLKKTLGNVPGANQWFNAAAPRTSNPLVVHGTEGAAMLMSPGVDVSKALNVASQTISAAKSKDPVKALQAMTMIANTARLAKIGDPYANRAIQALKAARSGKVNPMAKVLGMKFSIPSGTSKTAAISAANKLLSAAKGGNAKAKSVIKQTLAAANAGHAPSKTAAKVLATVHAAQKRGLHKKQAVRAAKGAQFTGAFLVDSKGNVKKGNFKAI